MAERLKIDCCGFDMRRSAHSFLEADADKVADLLAAEIPFPIEDPAKVVRGGEPDTSLRGLHIAILGAKRLRTEWDDATRDGLRVRTASSATEDITRDGVPARDPRHPQRGKWAALVLESDRAQATQALAPLLTYRASQDQALVLPGHPPGLLSIRRPAGQRADTWVSVIQSTLGPGQPWPRYLLLVGGPDRIPFEVQFLLDGMDLYTGRLDVSDLAGGGFSWQACATYAQRVAEQQAAFARAARTRQVLIYSTAADDPTKQAHQELAQPLQQHLRQTKAAVDAHFLFEREATRENLASALQAEAAPSVVFTISHGIEQPPDPILWGALSDCRLIQDEQSILSASSVPVERSFADGAVWFSFACHSAGVLQRSHHRSFQRLDDVQNVATDQVSALPRLLLGMRQGPLAFVGHVDGVTTLAFAADALQDGVGPYRDFIDWLTESQTDAGTLGRALSSLRECSGRTANTLVRRYLAARLRKPSTPMADVLWREWLRYLDYQGFILLGDPAITLA